LRPLAVNILGYLLMSSPMVREGLERALSYQRVVFGGQWIALIDRGASTLIRLDLTDIDPSHTAVETEYRAVIILKLLDWVTAIDFRVSEARFRHRPAGDRSEYERILNCPVKFQSTESELVVSRASLDQPSIHANPEIAVVHQQHAERHPADLEDQSVTRKVKTILMAQLDRGPSVLSEVACSLYMSPRTLQRRLAEEGTSFSETLDSLRRDLCLQHLERRGPALAEIAYVAGFSDDSAFNRAMRRWTGQTPLQYRRAHRNQHAGVDAALDQQ
jgi:AraC-like DNA-binding protein